MESKKVLLMFLGGAPKEPNIVQHWITMNSSFINKKNVYVVIHPMDYANEINSEFKAIFEEDNVYKVDEHHWVPTLWATKSLVDATLLMMQFAHGKNENKLYDKYILLSSTCCPLYRLDVIYEDITIDNKSIMDITNNSPTVVGQSQWMILDKQHVKIFFAEGRLNNTYIIIKGAICQQMINEPKQLNSLRLPNITQSNPPNDINLHNYYWKFHWCEIADETFFVEYIFRYFNIGRAANGNYDLSNPNILEHFRKITEVELQNNIKSIHNNILDNLKAISDTNLSTITYLEPIIFSHGAKFYENEKYKILSLFIKEIEFIYSTYLIVLPITEFSPLNVLRGFNLFKLNVNEYINSDNEPEILKGYVDSLMTGTCTYLSKRVGDVYNQKAYSLIPTTTHPIEYTTYTLRNILNTFILLLEILCVFRPKHKTTNDLHRYSIRTIIIMYINILVNEFDLYEENIEIYIDETKKEVKMVPIKSFLKDFINGTFDEMLDKVWTILSHKEYEITQIYKKINEKYKSYDKATLDTKMNKQFGTIINNNILLSAICHQSYFIRKCNDSSKIETFSNVLKELSFITSVPKINHTEFIIKPMKPFNFIGNINKTEDYFKNKYLKYKKKYIELKNIFYN